MGQAATVCAKDQLPAFGIGSTLGSMFDPSSSLLTAGGGGLGGGDLIGALGYIGPGAGFAAAGTVLVLLGTMLLALGVILVWPLRAATSWLARGKRGPSQAKRLVILGLDGMDPGLAQQFMEEGRMPHLKALSQEGCFHPLGTSLPSISPVAWSSFATGVDASHHNIYDFLTRDPCSYQPVLSSTDTRTLPRHINLGLAKVPFGQRAVHRILQKSQPFWKLLGQGRVRSSILRVPITYPAQAFPNGTLLSGMCVPDMQGTQGSFSFYSTQVDAQVDPKLDPASGSEGQVFPITVENGRVRADLLGPPDKSGSPQRCGFVLHLDARTGKAKLELGRRNRCLGIGRVLALGGGAFPRLSGHRALLLERS